MPAYEYICKDCNHEITVFLSIKEFEAKPKIKCPHWSQDFGDVANLINI
jgi:putative FmdB family regulatory protein